MIFGKKEPLPKKMQFRNFLKRNKNNFWYSIISIGVIYFSSVVLYNQIKDGVTVSPDSIYYLSAGFSLSRGFGFCYDTAADKRYSRTVRQYYLIGHEGKKIYRNPVFSPAEFAYTIDAVQPTDLRVLTHFPPLLSFYYALLHKAGISPYHVPIVASVIGWVIFLSGMGVLAYVLSGQMLNSLFALLLAAITGIYFIVFTYAWSEVLFLPLLIWAMIMAVLFIRRHKANNRIWSPTGFITLAFFACLPLCRYVGIVLLFGIFCWFIWRHIREGKIGINQQTLQIVLFFFLTALPFFLWILRNYYLGETPLGQHFEKSQSSFMDGIRGIAYESIRILLPGLYEVKKIALHSLFINQAIYFYTKSCLILFTVVITVIILYLFRHHLQWRTLITLPRSLLLVIVLFYILFYTFAQPFMAFEPMDSRDCTTALCLTQTWILGEKINLGNTAVKIIAGSFLLVNIFLRLGMHFFA